ncbi:MAG TPA: hypothetical protein DER01_14060, partial [Phycisphaerales bacterium]|nr:hypothetical protein [Phycisphaerales bacterium]
AQHQAAEELMSVGPIAVDPAAAMYIVVGDQPVDVRLTIRRGHRSEGDRLTVRAFDPDENLTFWQYVKAGQMRDTFGPGDMEVYGIPLQIPVKPQPHELMYDTMIQLKGKGVHQIRLSAGARNSVATLQFSTPVEYGISFQNGWFTPWDATLEKAYVYVPPHALKLAINGGEVTVHDASGQTLLHSNQTNWQEAPITQDKSLLTFDLPSDKGFKFRAKGFPVILCPTQHAANTIKASVIELEDGTVVSHKFQARIAKLLPELLKPENVGSAEELIKALESYKDAYLSHPLRNKNLLDQYAFMTGVGEILRNQNVDPNSHWGGSFGGKGGWQDRIDKPYPQNRWDTLSSSKGLYAGTSPRSSNTESLAYAYSIDSTLNPYHGKKELLYRSAAASLRDLMTLAEDENWLGVGADSTDYAGMMAFAVAQKTFPSFAHVAPHMSKEVQEVWTQGLRRIVDRMYPENMVTCRNQSSHYLVAFEAFAQGSGLPRYHELARAYAKRFRDEAHPSGYQIEQCGPDASYIGMTHWHEAVYYQMSKDPTILDALRESYGFFNKTVAPEPNGKKVLAGFNFNHRIGSGFYFEQWGGAKGILDDVLPEVGTWSRFSPRDQQAKDKASQSIAKTLSKPGQSRASNLTTMRYLYYTESPDQSLLFPAESKTSFIDNHNDELISVRQGDYYTVIYVGHPAPSNHYISQRENFRLPFANDAENKPGQVNVRKATPYVGGGMSLFWTPQFGTAIMSTNWSPVYRHGLVAQQDDLKRYWEDYFANSFKLDKNAKTLAITGKIEKQPLSYTRTYHFGKDGMQVQLEIKAKKAVQLKQLIEVFPFPTSSVKANGMTVTAGDQTTGSTITNQLTFMDEQGNGVQVDFDTAWPMTIAKPGLKQYNMQLCRVELQLPTDWKAGQKRTLQYTLLPITQTH